MDIQVWLPTEQTSERGNTVWIADPDDTPVSGKGWVVPQRGARAEVPGQQQVQVVTLGTTIDFGDHGLWARVSWDGKLWDVVTPPDYHHGTRHVRHWTVNLRRRPS